MREIKYRAFLKQGQYPQFHVGQIYEVFGYNKYTDINVIHIITEDGCRISVKRDDVILMEYTGVDDKNNQEIYEGDILKCEAEDYIGKVWFAHGAFMTDCEGFGDHPISQTHSDDFEKIGNIYQNGELLEV